MNWIGGARNRVRWQGERKLQKEFFDRKRLHSARSFLDAGAKGRNKYSQDLKALHTVSKTHSSLKLGENQPRKHIKVVNMDKFQSCTKRIEDVDLGPTSPSQAPSKIFGTDPSCRSRPIPWTIGSEKISMGNHEPDLSIVEDMQEQQNVSQGSYIDFSRSSSFTAPLSSTPHKPFSFIDCQKTAKRQLTFDPFASEDFQSTPLVHYEQKHKSQDRKKGKQHSYKKRQGMQEYDLGSFQKSKNFKHEGKVFTSTPLQSEWIHCKASTLIPAPTNEQSSILSPILECSIHSQSSEKNEKDELQLKQHYMTHHNMKKEHSFQRKPESPRYPSAKMSPLENPSMVNRDKSLMRNCTPIYSRKKGVESSYDADISSMWQLKSPMENASLFSQENTSLQNNSLLRSTPAQETTSSRLEQWRKPAPTPSKIDVQNSLNQSIERTRTTSRRTQNISLSRSFHTLDSQEETLSNPKKPKLTDLDEDFQYKPMLNYSFLVQTPVSSYMNFYKTNAETKKDDNDDEHFSCDESTESKKDEASRPYTAIPVKLEDIIEEVNQLKSQDSQDLLNLSHTALLQDGIPSESFEADAYFQSKQAVDLLMETDINHFQKVGKVSTTNTDNTTTESPEQLAASKITVACDIEKTSKNKHKESMNCKEIGTQCIIDFHNNSAKMSPSGIHSEGLSEVKGSPNKCEIFMEITPMRLEEAEVINKAPAAAIRQTTVWSVQSVGQSGVSSRSVGQSGVSSGSVGQSGVSPGSVGQSGVSSGSVGQFEVSSGSVGQSEVSSGSVGQSGVSSGSVGQFEVSSGSVGQSGVSSGSVGQFEVSSGSVGQFEVSSGSVGQFGVSSGSVGQSGVSSGSFGQSGVSSGSVGQFEVSSGSVGQFGVSSGSVGQSGVSSRSVGQFGVSSGSVGQFAVSSGSVGRSGVSSGSVEADNHTINQIKEYCNQSDRSMCKSENSEHNSGRELKPVLESQQQQHCVSGSEVQPNPSPELLEEKCVDHGLHYDPQLLAASVKENLSKRESLCYDQYTQTHIIYPAMVDTASSPIVFPGKNTFDRLHNNHEQVPSLYDLALSFFSFKKKTNRKDISS